ncbi:MAG: DUF445 domain-containing protein, partial [Pseudomonadota bacterium]
MSQLTPEQRLARLARMKRVALGLLVLMIAVYVVAGIYEPRWPWLGFVRAFAEAGTVGALADWFAVTALFRHPLGIPIPHTAIIQRRKDEIGATLSRFVAENFLIASALKPRLADLKFASAIGHWIARPENAARLTADVTTVLGRIVALGDNRALRDSAKDSLKSVLGEARLAPMVAQVLELLLLRDPDQVLVNGLLSLARAQLDENRQALQASISERTPWWLPKFVDKQIYSRVVDELESFLAETEESSDDEARERLTELLKGMIDSLRSDEDLIARGEALKGRILEHPLFERYLSTMVNDFSGYLSAELGDPDSNLRVRLTTALMGVADNLEHNDSLAADIDRACRDSLLYIVERYSDTIAGVITDT